MNMDYCHDTPKLKDYKNIPLVINIDKASNINSFYRIALWTAEHMQVTLMSIDAGSSIGAECHQNVDQFIKIESGNALVRMGTSKNNLSYEECVDCHDAVMIPAGTWHDVVNVGNASLKLFSVYAPAQHPYGTIHRTKEDAEH